ncbi:VanW family protein [Actinoplanes solisilvae]|uniref:VanW family protein n=1 Tax=Actinoplanes solisilvae TaxID=2486853 RepID=UPI000FDC19E2|nr:VanW family protein [Actinoplanes solisilvae]
MTSRSEGSVEQPRSGAGADDTVILNETPVGNVAASPAPAQRQPPPEERIPPVEAPRKRRKWLVAAGVTGLLAVGAGGTAAYVSSGDIPRGTEVLGLDLGALTRAEAEKAFGDHVAARATRPARVLLDGKDVTVEPEAVGLTFDVPATVEAAAGSGRRLFGATIVEPVVRLDEAKLEAALRKQVSAERFSIRKPGITFKGVTPVATYPGPGLDLEKAAAAERVRKAWPTGSVAEVPLSTRAPATTKEQVDALIADLAKPAVAAPVTVTVGAKSFRLTPAAVAKGLVFRSDNAGKLTAAIDGAKLRKAGAAEFGKVETAAKPATVQLRDGKPQVVNGAPGRLVDLDKLESELLTVLAAPAPRAVSAVLAEKQSDTSAADVAKLGIKEKVSTFTTYFTGGRSSPRSQNIITIAKDVDGAILRPGKTFSLNGHTGERDYASGYKDAPVIVNGVLEPGVGGGASQFTTTLFNAAYYAGLKDVEHKPHSFYFSRYPSVIESTIFYPSLDLKFKNTTPYGILIDTATTGRSVTVTMWSTKVYDSVKTVYGPRRNATSPPTQHRPAGPKCIASSGLPGFTQDAWRVIRKDGREIEREKFTWRYDPEPRFVCGGD